MIAAFAVSLALLALSGLLIDSHRRSWHSARAADQLPERMRRFAASQYRRRMQASAMIGLIGAGIGVWPVVPRQPGPMAFYVAVLVAACGWIMLLALADYWATRQYFARLRNEQLAAQLKLALEMRAAAESTEAEA